MSGAVRSAPCPGSAAPRLWLGLALAACGGAPPAEPRPQVSPVALTRAPVAEPAETDDGVVVSAGKGHVEPAAVEAAIGPYRSELSSCYTRRVGGRRWLGGRLVVRWELAANGAIERVLLADGDLGAWPIERCVLDTARRASFGRPIGGAAEVVLPLEFSLCQPVPGARGARPAGDASDGCSVRGRAALWDEVASAKAVGSQLAKLDACATATANAAATTKATATATATAKLRPAPDDVQITLYVGRAGRRGRVESVGFASGSGEIDEAWAACAEKAALAWRLPDPGGQIAKLAVRYRPH
ncbi:MAG TPA: AgmX/PglI C-terminal domain-containing protein [Kofleriaceae bacterium]|nr:AgmX/PglI C-terminal domain-containing protein [Kofleriaceae bacterium]